ncbi:MAG: glycine zipper 2TM domain-containing protein [Gemmatimonadota bacterium]
MRGTRKLPGFLVVIAMVAGQSRVANAQRAITGPFGAVAGTLSGGYITLSIVVAKAQVGDYLHEANDLFDWKGLPVIIGASTGTALGIWDPDRLMTGFVYGSIGTLAGGSAGYLIGMRISDRPEGKWAGGAIGAGIGMAIGSTLGVFVPNRRMNPFRKDNTAVPLAIRVPL